MNLDIELVKEKIKTYRSTKNCAQSTLMGICEVAGLPPEELEIIATGFGGGIGGTFDEGTCGAVTGAVIALGFLGADKKEISGLSKELFNAFKEEYGSTACGVISKKGEDKSPCIDVCLFAGENVANSLNNRE